MFGNDARLWMLAVLVPAMAYACWSDYRRHRVPNTLNLAILLTGLGTQVFMHGWSGLKIGLLGVLVGFGMLIVCWLMRAMGAGDVKYMAALGAWMGPELTFYAVLVGGVIGGVMALAAIARQRSWVQASANVGLLMTKMSSARTAFSDYASAQQLGASSGLLPYAIPLTIGAVSVLILDYSGWWGVL